MTSESVEEETTPEARSVKRRTIFFAGKVIITTKTDWYVHPTLDDKKRVIKKAPNDANAKLRMTECERIIKRDAFLKAIEVEDAPSAAEGLDIEHMALEKGYTGPDLKNGMTLEFIEDMIEKFKNGTKLAKKKYFLSRLEV